MHPGWLWFLCFMAGVLAVALYGLTASGHFPAETRAEKFKRGSGALVLWASLAATGLAAAGMLTMACWILPWHLALLGAGGMLLFAPLLLQAMPDSFLDGRRGLVVLGTCAVLLAALMWFGRH
jgi:hypothetical protein